LQNADQVAVFPDLPGCVAFSHSMKTLRREASIALLDYIEDAESRGMPLPEPSSSQAICSDPKNEGCYIGRVTACRQEG
jgi:predicted RNase H-like HicB family nuclease